MMKKLRYFAIFVLLSAAIGAGVYGYLHFGGKDDKSLICDLVVDQLPAAELATRTVVWQSIISENENFPARYFVIGRTATIKAGFDLAKLDPAKDIVVDAEARTITLKLPKAEILSLAWGNNRVIMERHSVAAAVSRKSAEEENRRRKLFEEALRRDARLYDLLDLATLNEGITRYLEPLVARHGWKLVVQMTERVDFSDALDAYITAHP